MRKTTAKFIAAFGIGVLLMPIAPGGAFGREEVENPILLNNRGVEAMNAGDFKEAMRLFHQALELTPEDTLLLHNLAMAMNNQAVQYLADTRPDPAVSWLTRAIQIFPDPMIRKNLSQALMMKAREEADGGRPDLAMQLYRDAVSADPESPAAREFLGRTLYDAGRLEDALKEMETSYRLEPRDAVRTFADKIRRETEGEKNFFEQRGLHFRIFYSPDIRAQDLARVSRALEQAYQDHRMFLGDAPKREIRAVFYSSKQGFTSTHDLTSNVAGIYDGKVRLPIPENPNWESIERTLSHEVAHAFLFDIGGVDIPLWLNEGMAELLSAGLDRPTPNLERAVQTQGKFVPIRELSQTLKNMKNNTQAALAYDQSFSISRFIHDRYGVFGMRRILQAFKEGQREDEALEKTIFMSPEILQQSWESRLLR